MSKLKTLTTRLRLPLIALPALIVTVISLFALLSAVTNAAAFSKPGDVLYPLRQPALEIKHTLTLDPEERATLEQLLKEETATPAENEADVFGDTAPAAPADSVIEQSDDAGDTAVSQPESDDSAFLRAGNENRDDGGRDHNDNDRDHNDNNRDHNGNDNGDANDNGDDNGNDNGDANDNGDDNGNDNGDANDNGDDNGNDNGDANDNGDDNGNDNGDANDNGDDNGNDNGDANDNGDDNGNDNG
ncbi:MAG: hypothetical protein D6706_00550, partial [Chloroflexi bacterium]